MYIRETLQEELGIRLLCLKLSSNLPYYQHIKFSTTLPVKVVQQSAFVNNL